MEKKEKAKNNRTIFLLPEEIKKFREKIIKTQELDKNFVKIALKKTKQQSITKK